MRISDRNVIYHHSHHHNHRHHYHGNQHHRHHQQQQQWADRFFEFLAPRLYNLCATKTHISLPSAQSFHRLCYPHEEAFGPWLPIVRPAKTDQTIGWSESLLGAHGTLQVFLCSLLSAAQRTATKPLSTKIEPKGLLLSPFDTSRIFRFCQSEKI